MYVSSIIPHIFLGENSANCLTAAQLPRPKPKADRPVAPKSGQPMPKALGNGRFCWVKLV